MKIDEAIQFLGYSSENKELGAYLTTLGISERLIFDENPEEWLAKEEGGFILIFHEKYGYESLYGPTNVAGDMIFKGIRLYGPQNTDDFHPYKDKLPYGLDFEQNPDQIKKILGAPDFEDEPNTPKRVLIWNNFKGMEIGVVMNKDETQMSYFDIQPVQSRYHR